MKRIFLLIFLLINLFILGSIRISFVYADSSTSIEDAFDISSFRNNTYLRKLKAWEESYEEVNIEEQRFSISNYILSNPDLDFFHDIEYQNTITNLEKNDVFTYELEVEKSGLYHLGLDFFLNEEFYTIPSVMIIINDEILYNELNEVKLEVFWESVPLEEEYRYNIYGNELLPKVKSVNKWQKYYYQHTNALTHDPLLFLLEEGVNKIEIVALNLGFYLGDLYLKTKDSKIDYQTYKENNSELPFENLEEMIVIQGQDFSYKNDLEIKSSYYKESKMTPYTYKHTVLNRLDGQSMARGGMKVVYQFDIEVAGYYNIALKALQNDNYGVAVAKNIYIDNQLLFEELSGVLFSSSRTWQNIVLGEEEAYQFYFEVGKHEIAIESTNHIYANDIDELNYIMDDISSISLLVKTITGGNINDTVDWDVLKYIPDLVTRLENYANKLEEIYQKISNLDSSKSAGEITTLNVAAKQLRRIARNPNRIGSKLNEFSDGSGSAYQLIGNGITYLLSQPLSIDCIYIYNNVDLPKANGNFFVKLWDGIRSFFYSFFDTRYNNRRVSDETLEVWVSQSSLYLDIIQSMIDQDFSQKTGIEVRCSILNNIQKIVLSNATDANPDVVLSIDNWNPYAYALRGILTDLSEFEDFDLVSKNYYANNFAPVIFEDGVYSIPETQSVYLMYYRKDIFSYLELDPPDTWSDVIDMLPILQSHKMNFYHPLGGDSSYKGYGLMAPIIYQFGGEIYSENGVESMLRDEQTIQAVKFATELFTIYNLPLQVSSFFEHFRSGSMPIGISTIDLYLQLKYAAPELSGQWDVLVIPGNDLNNDGVIKRYAPTYGKVSMLFSNSDKQNEGWELIKWWNSTETQIKFMQNIKTSLGEKFLVLSANMEALEASVWDEGIKNVTMEQASWARIPAVTPGSYIVERELSNIWNKVVIDKMNPLIAINQSIPRVERELSRKADEFGYVSLNNPIGKDYIIPIDDNIRRWIKEAYDEEN